ncbi:MAG: putative drug exporter of the superfamily, partial [Solirubrobacteraceae bacterium]|nr:putative drug exporter of the superfamily [Solirubrobacteraceae bacterium]
MADFVVRRRRRILAAGAVLFLVGIGFGGPVANKLTARSSDFQDPASEAMAAQTRLSDATGGRDGPGLVALVRTRGDIRRDPAARRKIERVTRILAGQPEVGQVVSYTSAHDPSLVSRDGHAAFVAGSVKQSQARAVVNRLRKQLAGHHVTIGGQQVVFTEIAHRVSHDLARAELLAFPILLLLSLWVFRGMVAALLPPLIGGVTIVTTFALLRLVDAHVTTLSIFALNLVTGMGLGLAIDYGLFMVSRYREELARVGPGKEALSRTMATAGRTVLFSSLTVAAAVSTLLLFPLRFLYSMAIGGVICALIAAAVSLVVLPAVLAALGPRVNALAPLRWQRAAEREASDTESGWWYRLSRIVMRRPVTIALAAATVLILAGLPFLRINFGAADYRVLPTGSEARQVSEAITSEFPRDPSEPFEVAIAAPRSAASEVQSY